jgi:site-specific recombinase XerD
VPLRPLFESYGKEAQLSPATVKRWSPVVDRLIGHLGHDDAAAIARADVVAWKDALLDGGMKNITVRDVYLASTKAMFQFAVDQGLLADNPAKEVKVRVRKKVKEREKGFDGEEAAKILAATQGPFSHLISVEMTAARRWLPWIFDQAIAAPSMKAALEAWGADSNLFHQGAARESDDPDVVAATMAKPGAVLRRPVGSTGP